MKHHDSEDLYIRSLDADLTQHENAILAEAIDSTPGLKDNVLVYSEIREKLRAKEPATFGPFFATRVVHVISESAVVIDHYLFSFFRKFQLAAAGVVIGLLALNVIFTDQIDVMSILGLGDTSSREEVTIVFDFFESINENL